ncbi:MAG: hypothetical protein WCV50_00875 [Patescibacteria group bacterium]|jgi:hypothetical protein
MPSKKIIKNAIICIMAFFMFPVTALAVTFNPNHIISDIDMTNANATSLARIQNFLSGQGALGTYKTTDANGNEKTAAEILYEVGRQWTINPQYLMVRMQIEQSLITDSTPSQAQLDWATGYAVCDSCSKDDPAVAKYKGFYNQVLWSARKIRESYLADLELYGRTFTGWGPGITKTTGDGYQVTPANNATAALYTYTPYVYNANFNIWKFWNQWFTKHYPDGSLVQVEGENGVYLIKDGKRRPFLSRSALVSRFDPSKIILVSLSDINAYPDGAPIKFANYSLILSNETGRVYLIDGDQRRYIESPDVFREIGFNPEEIIKASESELSAYSFGPNINMRSIYPTGVLLQSKETGGISYVENGVRQSIWSKEILKNRFATRKPVVVEQSEIDQYPQGDPITFKDGELITSPGMHGVYFVNNGIRHGIASKETFDALGFQWKNIIWTTDKAVLIHLEGDPIDINQQ